MGPKRAIAIILGGAIVAFSISDILLDPSSVDVENNSRPLRSPKSWPVMDGNLKNIFWVVQISDIHFSIYIDPNRGPDLLKLCEDYLSVINPESILVTGDLTDAKVGGSIDSMQYHDEWIMYQNVIKRCTATTRGRWVDIRGNHDCFDVYNSSSYNNYFRSHSATGHVMSRQQTSEYGFIHKIELPFGSYSFVGIDACSRPGPNRPFNFFGYIGEKQKRHIESLAAKTTTSNHTVWFGHFPTSVIVQDPPNLRQIMSGSILYLCGHLHTLGNLVPQMYARHKTGQLELELGDWKDNRLFRIIAFDHDLVSFVDSKFGEETIILVTNPKNNQHLSPLIEPVEMIAFSSHIRILVFSLHQVHQVNVHIDEEFLGSAKRVDSGSPLYVLPWKPSALSEATHTIRVTVKTAKDQSTVSQTFSVNGEEKEFRLFPQFLLLINIYTLGKFLFALSAIGYILTLTFLKRISNIRKFYFRGRNPVMNLVNQLLMKVWLASRVSLTYSILVGSVIYLAFGPWFAAYLLRGHLGVVFSWGIIINNTLLPGGLTYIYGLFQIIAFSTPFALATGHVLDMRRKQGSDIKPMKHCVFIGQVCLLFLHTAYLAFGEFTRAYGWQAVAFGPLRTGNLILLPLTLWLAMRVDMREVMMDCGNF